MVSLYIHIPFCDKKCGYCNFTVLPVEGLGEGEKNNLIQKYIDKIIDEIISVSNKVKGKNIKTIYFGGGTPACIQEEGLKKIIDTVLTHFACEFVEELSIELNPYPPEQTLEIIKSISTSYDFLPRVRFSIGIQSFDEEILQLSGRNYTFRDLQDFLRKLWELKKAHVVLNADFIAFGKKPSSGTERTFWDEERLEFFEKILQSQMFDSFSVYMLELFEGSDWHLSHGEKFDHLGSKGTLNTLKVDQTLFDQEYIAEEFEQISEIIQEYGYRRYEVSNFALSGKSSIHNRVYRSGGDYIGIGTSASSYLNDPELIEAFFSSQTVKAVRWTNIKGVFPYIKKIDFEPYEPIFLTSKDILIEQFFLGLRSDFGIKNIENYESVLVDDYKAKIDQYVEQELLVYDRGIVFATDKGLNVINQVCIELLKEL